MRSIFLWAFLGILLSSVNIYSGVDDPNSDANFLKAYLADAAKDYLSGNQALRIEQERVNKAAQARAPSPTGTAAGLVTRVLLPDLDEQGLPTPGGLLTWLKNADIMNVSDQTHISLLKIGGDRLAAGSKALKMFVVGQGERSVLIIKVFRDRAAALDEARLISKVQVNKRIMATQSIFHNEMPRLIFTEKFYDYQDQNGEIHAFSVIHSAGGESLWDLISSYLEAPSSDRLEALKKVYQKFGETLANFHLTLMDRSRCPLWYTDIPLTDAIHQCSTILHGDLNPKNVFAKQKSTGMQISFIDIESMGHFLPPHRASPLEDLVAPFAYLILFRGPRSGREDESVFFSLVKDLYTTFLISYFSYYKFHVSQPKAVLPFWNELEESFRYRASIFYGILSPLYLKKVKELRQEILREVTQTLEHEEGTRSPTEFERNLLGRWQKKVQKPHDFK